MPPRTIPLRTPLRIGDETRSVLTMREPLLEDQLAVTKPGMSTAELEVALIARLADVPAEALRRHPLRDYQALSAALADFLS
jgi:hypothetical protein